MPTFDDFMIHDEFFQSKTNPLEFIIGDDHPKKHEIGSWARQNCKTGYWARSTNINVWWTLTFSDPHEVMLFKLTWMGQ